MMVILMFVFVMVHYSIVCGVVGSLEREQLSLAVVVMMGFKGIHASSSAVHELFKVMLRSVRW